MVKLEFENKKSIEDILSISKKYKSCNFKDGNYLIKGDNFDALSILLKSGFKSKIDLVYIDPPFLTQNIFTVSKNRSSTISRAKNGKVAYSDKFTLDEYLNLIRDRLIIIHSLLSDKGSIYLHIDDKASHYIKLIMDEIFGIDNFKNDITRIKSNPKNFYRKAYGNEKDTILFYVKNNSKCIWNDIKIPLTEEEVESRFSLIDKDGRYYNTVPIHAPGETKNGVTSQSWRGIKPPEGRHWRVSPDELELLDQKGLIHWSSTGNPRLKRYADEHTGKKIQDVWIYKDPQRPIYPTEKNLDMLEMIIAQSSNKESIVLDCFAGGGGTLVASHKLGRRFIGVDSSEHSIETIKNRFQSKNLDYEFLSI